MTNLRFYNTMTRATEPLELREPGKATVYNCGPTTYDAPHAGHARQAIAFDVLVRHLANRGLAVTYVRNITDVDDKILERAKQRGEDPMALSARMARVYQEDMRALGCVTPTVEPRVSEHIDDILALVDELVANGSAYVVDRADGTRDVYFAVRQFPGYGKLSRRKLDEQEIGARVERDAEKRDPLDFALWKGATAEEWGWPSPWGRGRPGWHIECSAMSRRYLGHGFDIHGGGMDLIFPHHENEIAQSEAASPGQGPVVRCWMHNGFLNVDKEKMSKSLGNFVTVRDVFERNDPEAFRWFLLGVHYRGPLHFDTEKLSTGRVLFPGIDEAEGRVDYAYDTLERLRELAGDDTPTLPSSVPDELEPLCQGLALAFGRGLAGLDDDLNTPVALAALGELLRLSNELCDLAAKRKKDPRVTDAARALAGSAAKQLGDLAESLGVLSTPSAAYRERTRARRLALRGLDAAWVEARLAARAAARAAKDFAAADALRAELVANGITLKDTRDGGSSWAVAP